jgi:ABC-type glycerol-3-phosphate transport system permease component
MALAITRVDRPADQTVRARRSRAVRPAWQEKPSVVTRLVKGVVLLFIGVVMLYPFVYVIGISFASAKAAVSDTLFPTEFSLAAYKSVLSGGLAVRALEVSIGITAVGTAISVALTVLMAYGLSRTRDVPGSRFILLLVLFTMLFSAGIIPNYLVVKQFGMIDTYAALIVPGVISAFNLVVMRNFFMDLPRELFDSARTDGASEWQILCRIVLPLSRAIIAVIALFYGVTYWNDFFNALIYLNDTHKWPVQLLMQQYILQGGGSPLDTMAQNNPALRQTTPKTIQMAVVVLSVVPILIVYPFMQRFFTKGVLTGAVKG